MEIREARATDIDLLLHHRREMFREMGYVDRRVLDECESVSREYFAEALREGWFRAWLAETEEGLVAGGGGVLLAPWPGGTSGGPPRRAWILNVYVEPAWRRRGIARGILLTAIQWCRAEGLPHVSLHASAEGRPLYESMGFRPTNEMRLYLEER